MATEKSRGTRCGRLALKVVPEKDADGEMDADLKKDVARETIVFQARDAGLEKDVDLGLRATAIVRDRANKASD